MASTLTPMVPSVRGQRTKSTGRTEGTIGVNVEAIKEEMDDEEEGGEEV